MGESTCVMQTFSPLPSEPQEGNQIGALGESVSFGRFMTDSLAWEKWSSFNHNRYLEEVEKYSKPGSVAQKKAYFEAHYKKKLAEKAAAAAAAAAAVEEHTAAPDNWDGEVVVNNGEGVYEVSTSETFGAKGGNSNFELIAVEVDDPVVDDHVVVMDGIAAEASIHHEEVENRMTTDVKLNVAVSSEKLPLQENSCANQENLVQTIKKPNVVSKNSRPSKLPSTPAIPRTPVNPRKENNPTPNSKKRTTSDSTDKRRSTPKSLHISLNSPLAPVAETNKTTTTPRVQKIKDPKVAAPLTKTPRSCSSPVRPSRVPKPPPLTSYPYSRRTKAPVDQTKAPGTRKMDVKCKSLSVGPSESSATAWAPSVSSSFSLRSEERAAKRREYFQKLQEEQNAREAHKMQLQAKSEEKAEVELRRLRQNLGFKAKPMPDFYREPQSQKTQLKKIPLTVPHSPKLGRKPNSSALHETNPLPPRTPSAKNDTSKQAMSRTSRTRTPISTPNHSVMSTPRRSAARENASPNIQR